MRHAFLLLSVLTCGFLSFLQGQEPRPAAPLRNTTVMARLKDSPLHVFDKKRPYRINARGKVVVEGDIILADASKLEDTQLMSSQLKIGFSPFFVKYKPAHCWTYGIVPFVIDVSAAGKQTEIEAAIKEVQGRTGLVFTKRTDQKSWIRFVGMGDQPVGGESSFGMIGGEQEITLADSAKTGTVLHELGHALGLAHEHMRNDRDSNLEIKLDNILDDYREQFMVLGIQEGVTSPNYDYASVMHYWSTAFGKSSSTKDPVTGDYRLVTLVPKHGGRELINFKEVLSPADAENIDKLYRPEYEARETATQQNKPEVKVIKFQ